MTMTFADLHERSADLKWWEAAFGSYNVISWNRRQEATVNWAEDRRHVDAALRNWVMENTTHP